MYKAIFVDYTGTIIEEGGPDLQEVIMRTYKNSSIESPQAMVEYWGKLQSEYEEKCVGESYMTEDEIVIKLLEVCQKEIHLKENIEELHRLFQRFWMYAPAFSDTAEFFVKCIAPIYVISNNSKQYIEVSMKEKGLHPAGIICADMVKAYKPNKAIFEKALEVSGCQPGEVVHIGDSYTSDVLGAVEAGIKPILVDRTGKWNRESFRVVRSLPDALPFIQ